MAGNYDRRFSAKNIFVDLIPKYPEKCSMCFPTFGAVYFVKLDSFNLEMDM